MPLYVFRCQAGHEIELIRPYAVNSVRCLTCQRTANRQSVYHMAQVQPEHKLPGKDFIEASAMLASKQEEFAKKEGVTVAAPPLWQMANAKAQRLIKQGAPDSRSTW